MAVIVGDRQLTLDLGHRPALGRDDFLLAPCNSEAVAWLERWPDWPHHALALHGPQGCGKTHLLSLFGQHHALATKIIAASQLSAEDSLRMQLGPATIIDDLDALRDETALFHLWNRTKENGLTLLLAGRTAPARLPVTLPDLRSRLAGLHAVRIGEPDEDLLAAILVKLFADRQLRVTHDVIGTILTRGLRDVASVGALVAHLDRLSLAQRKPITLKMVRDVLNTPDERQGELQWN